MEGHIERRIGLARGGDHAIGSRIEAIKVDAEMGKPAVQTQRQQALGAHANRRRIQKGKSGGRGSSFTIIRTRRINICRVGGPTESVRSCGLLASGE